ncbi:MAG: DUF4445 domain-containing protein [Dehalococcoidales bacterium]|nr:DUF4445 domain-containing protein [Dehalococcoidales bacterium]
MSADTCQVIFQPSGKRGKVATGTRIKEASISLGVDIEGSCGSAGTCGKCRVKIAEGFFDKYGIESKLDHVNSPEEHGYVLACQAEIQGDIVVFVPEESRLENQVVRKSAGNVDITLDPAVKACYLELHSPNLEHPTADWERVQNRLYAQYGLNDLGIDRLALSELPQTLRDSEWNITAFVWNDREVIRIVPGQIDHYYGMAFDIGTTTIAGYLCDLSDRNLVATVSMMNPQVVYGEDVMSRISYAMANENGLDALHHSVIEALNALVSNACSVVDISTDAILDMTVAGNTCMHHLFLGIHPQYIGKAPFVPAITNSFDIKARETGIRISKGSFVHTLPLEAGFVGADNVAVLLSAGIHHRAGSELIIDIGTNGEIVLLEGDRMMSCSCATGPAFEGAEITFGIRAVAGAIERLAIDRTTGDVRFKVIGEERWNDEAPLKAKGICGSGIIDIVPQLYLAGIIDHTGRFTESFSHPRLRVTDEITEYVIVWKEQTTIDCDITVRQSDIRAIQLAKAAMYTGARLMMKKAGIHRIDSIKLAGAFGNYIDKRSAAMLGLFPDCDIDSISSIGNAAGDGARMALLNRGKRREADEISRQVEYFELTGEPEFEKMFTEAMWIPHMKDDFPHLTEYRQ